MNKGLEVIEAHFLFGLADHINQDHPSPEHHSLMIELQRDTASLGSGWPDNTLPLRSRLS